MRNYVAFADATVRAQDAFYLPHGDGAINSIDTRDVAAAAATVLTEDGHEIAAAILAREVCLERGPQAPSVDFVGVGRTDSTLDRGGRGA